MKPISTGEERKEILIGILDGLKKKGALTYDNVRNYYTRPQAAVSMLTNVEVNVVVSDKKYRAVLNYWGGLHDQKDTIVIRISRGSFLLLDYRKVLNEVNQSSISIDTIYQIEDELFDLLTSPSAIENYKEGRQIWPYLVVVRRADTSESKELILKGEDDKIYRILSLANKGYGEVSILKNDQWHCLASSKYSLATKLLGSKNWFNLELFDRNLIEESLSYIEKVMYGPCSYKSDEIPKTNFLIIETFEIKSLYNKGILEHLCYFSNFVFDDNARAYRITLDEFRKLKSFIHQFKNFQHVCPMD